MSKDTPWFRHDSNARLDPKIQGLIGRHGYEGYGRFWSIIETLREQEGYKLPDAEYVYDAFALQWQCNCNAASEFISELVDRYQLLVRKDGLLYSESLVSRMSRLSDRREKMAENARKRWENANALQGECNGNAIAMQTDASRVEKRRVEKKKKTTVVEIVIPEKLAATPGFSEAWDEWTSHRREIGKPMKPTAANRQLKQLEAMPDPVAAIHHSVASGYQGVYPPSDKRAATPARSNGIPGIPFHVPGTTVDPLLDG